jgi:hypothetical protein
MSGKFCISAIKLTRNIHGKKNKKKESKKSKVVANCDSKIECGNYDSQPILRVFPNRLEET